jgi:putative heme-binding domain-containing protein
MISQRQLLAAELIGDLRVIEMKPWLTKQLQNHRTAWRVRAACARALLKVRQSEAGAALIPLIGEDTIGEPARESICQVIMDDDPTEVSRLTTELFRSLPLRHQATIARGMSSASDSGRALLALVRSGQASARLLQIPIVFEQLKVALGETSHAELQAMVAELPAWDATVQSNLTNRLQQFRSKEASVELGRQVFRKHCATCHQVAGEGALVGPQLDGIGMRGDERVIEDLLAPYRNVDGEFRTSIVSTHDGQVISGLIRSRKDGTLLLVNSEGKEVSLREDDIDQVDQIRTSIMPENFTQLIPDESLNDLIAYLLSLRTK